MNKLFAAILMAVCLATQLARGDVWQDLAQYKYGDEKNAADQAAKLLQQTPVDQRGAIEDGLIAVVSAPDATPDGKAFACRMLQQVATEKSIPAVAALLTDEVLSHYARLVLERLGSPKADAAMRAALDNAPDKAKVGIIGSLGERRDGKAVKQITKLAQNADPAVATAAIRALGKIGGSDAANCLGKLKPSDKLKAVRLEAMVSCAQSLKGARAVSLYDQVLASDLPSYRIAALNGLLTVDEKKAIGLMVAAVKGEDDKLRLGVLTLVAEGKGASVTKAMVEILGQLPNEKKIGLLVALGQRGDKAAQDGIMACAASPEAAIRQAALTSLGKVGDAGTAKVLLGMADPQVTEIVGRMPGADVNSVLIEALADNKLKVAAIKALVARNCYAAVPGFLTLIKDPDADPRRAAWAGLGALAAAEEMPTITQAAFAIKDESELGGALAAVRNVYARTGDKGKYFDLIAANYDPATDAGKSWILELGALAGTPSALALEKKAIQSGNKDLSRAAVRALAEWCNQSAAGDLLDLAKSAPTEVDQIVALRGYIRIAAMREFNLNPNERMAMFQKASELAKRADEKKLIISGLASAGSADALSMTSKCWDDPDLRDEAEQTGSHLIESLKSSHPTEVKELATKLATSKNAGVADRAKRILAELNK